MVENGGLSFSTWATYASLYTDGTRVYFGSPKDTNLTSWLVYDADSYDTYIKD